MTNRTGINQIRQAYLDFFTDKKHASIPPAPLAPHGEDTTTLFTGSGMQQLVPYLKGEEHPMGTRLVNSQPCFRAEDIEEVGDNRHTTFFEMLGNWSLGDYFKEEQLSWFWEFLTQVIKLPKDKLHATVFEGNKQVPKDEESYNILLKLGLRSDHIHYYPAEKNWWSRAGLPENMPPGEIGGPDSEVFYDFGPDHQFHEKSPWKNETCHINCDCGRYLEIGNSVFIQYEKQKDGSFKELPNKNVDFGGGLERIAAASENQPDMFLTDSYKSIIDQIIRVTSKAYADTNIIRMRKVADHIKASIFIVNEGIEPSNKLQGSVLRRLLRQAIFNLRQIENNNNEQDILSICDKVFELYKDSPTLITKAKKIKEVIGTEVYKFTNTLNTGLPKYIKKINKYDFENSPRYVIESELKPYDIETDDFIKSLGSDVSLPSAAIGATMVSGTTTYGLPLEFTMPEIIKGGYVSDLVESDLINANEKVTQLHQELSKLKSSEVFKGGLADHSETITKYHTTTHLLHQALRDILGSHVQQMGSNITNERLRFDFKHSEKLSDEEKSKVEEIINQKVKEDLPVTKSIESKDDALKSGALAFFKEKYPEKVNVYTIGKNPTDWYSKELCGGPHVSSTGKIGPVTIKKEQSIGAGTRRIYITLKSGSQ